MIDYDTEYRMYENNLIGKIGYVVLNNSKYIELKNIQSIYCLVASARVNIAIIIITIVVLTISKVFHSSWKAYDYLNVSLVTTL